MTSEQGRSPTSYKIQLGTALAGLMKSRGVEVARAAKVLECSEDKIRTYVRGRSSPNAGDLTLLLDLLEVAGEEREDLEQLGREARKRSPRTPWGKVIPDRLRRFFRIEETAERIRYYHPTLVYGLAQPEEFARAILGADPDRRQAEIQRLVDARMARGRRLVGPRPPKLVMIFSEAILLQKRGGPVVRKALLLHLIDLVQNHGVEIHIVPFDTEEVLPETCPFVVFDAEGQKTVVYLENQTDGIFVDEPDRVATYEQSWERLLAGAMSAKNTIALLVTVASEL